METHYRTTITTPQDLYPGPGRSRAFTLARQAEHWGEHVQGCGETDAGELWRRALGVVRFSAEVGTHDLAVPAELESTFHHEGAIKRLHEGIREARGQTGFKLGFELAVKEDASSDGRLIVYYDEEALGFVPGEDEVWLRPLLSHGVGVHVLGVRITPRPTKRTCRVVFTGVASALSQVSSSMG